MSAHTRSGKLIPLAATGCLVVAAAFGGYAIANSHNSANGRVPETFNLAGATSGQGMTVYACVASGRLTHVSVTASPQCPAGSVPIQWSAQSGSVSAASPAPTASSSSTAAPSAPPSASSAPPASPATSAPASAPAGTSCVVSSNNGTCGPYAFAGISGSGGESTRVIQDVWNPIKGASQTLTAINPGDWSVSADMPASNTAVVSYPDTQQIYTTTSDTPNPLSTFASITSSYTEIGPTGGGDDYEAAYDIWTGTGSSNYAQEIMIWVDNHGQRPAGSDVASATIDGVGYQVWSSGRAGAVGDPVSLVLDSNQSSAQVNVLDDLNWLVSNGYMPAGSGVNQIDFGWEICSTGGVPQTFTLSQYGIKASCTSGSSCTQ